jgi:sodium/proton antiporter, NhaA family (TC 2.A.33.1.1)
MDVLAEPLTMGIAAGLMLGKLVGVVGTVALLVKLGLAHLPAKASWGQLTGTAFLCGIGFTMSLFIGLLAFDDPTVQDHVKSASSWGRSHPASSAPFSWPLSVRRTVQTHA